MTEQLVKKYCRQVQRACPAAYRKRLTADLQDHISDFLEAHPDADRAALTAHFGDPREFAAEYLSSLDKEQIKKELNRTAIVRRGIILALLIVIVGITITLVTMIIWNEHHEITTIITTDPAIVTSEGIYSHD